GQADARSRRARSAIMMRSGKIRYLFRDFAKLAAGEQSPSGRTRQGGQVAMASEIERQGSSIGGSDAHPGSIEALLEALRRALSMGGAEAAQSRFIAALELAILDAAPAPQDAHWHLHALALACFRAGDALLARGRLEPGVDMLRRGLAIRERLAG